MKDLFLLIFYLDFFLFFSALYIANASYNEYILLYINCDLCEYLVNMFRFKVKVLTDLGFFSEAIVNLTRLLNGERLPQTADSAFRQFEIRGQPSEFDNSKPLMDPSNIKVCWFTKLFTMYIILQWS